jgi:DNA-directed RNA polymerase subunit RPC12/RpoP
MSSYDENARLKCPQCASQDTRRSERRGPFERVVLPLLYMRPYRCMDCDARFYARRRLKAAIIEQRGANPTMLGADEARGTHSTAA